jgi:hypothetical protein
MASVFLAPFGSVVLTMKIIGTNKPKLELFFISQDWHTKKRILMQVHGGQDFINLIKTVKGFAHADYKTPMAGHPLRSLGDRGKAGCWWLVSCRCN